MGSYTGKKFESDQTRERNCATFNSSAKLVKYYHGKRTPTDADQDSLCSKRSKDGMVEELMDGSDSTSLASLPCSLQLSSCVESQPMMHSDSCDTKAAPHSPSTPAALAAPLLNA